MAPEITATGNEKSQMRSPARQAAMVTKIAATHTTACHSAPNGELINSASLNCDILDSTGDVEDQPNDDSTD